MLIYLICFLVSTLLIYGAEHTKIKFYKKMLMIGGLLIPCFLAGIRSLNIGTDVNVYLKPMFLSAKNSVNFEKYLNSYVYGLRIVRDYEFLFYSVVYFISKLFDSIHILMFVIQLLIIVPIYLGMKNLNEMKNNIWFGMLVFYLAFFNNGLNYMRQYIGLAFSFWAISCLLKDGKNKLIKCLILLVIAFLFHKSSILSVFIILLYYLFNEKNKKIILIKFGKVKISSKSLLGVCILIFGLILIFNISIIGEYLYTVDGLSRYSMYTKEFIKIGSNFIKVIPLLLLVFIYNKKIIKNNVNGRLFLFIYYLGYLVLTQLQMGSRISSEFTIFSTIVYPLVCDIPEKKESKQLLKIIVITYLIIYWWITFVYQGYCETVPFSIG